MKAKDSAGPLSEINVVPLVDIMLVLLIIFMIASPMMQHGLGVDLPKTTNMPLPIKDEPQVVTIDKYLKVILNEKSLSMEMLPSALQFVFADRTEKEILLKADSSVPYGFVAQCMAAVKKAGVNKINLVTNPLDD
ncbi:MAG TPA: ExbD/TolR family protein [Syntrophorhabdaceae bacterium]|nr:ExbD/TolR family protein [Syntrophorhabdaceae bacterium]